MAGASANPRSTVTFDDGTYSVMVEEIGPLWRWVICEDGEAVQEGASISEFAARSDSERVVGVFRRMGSPAHRAQRAPEEPGQ